MGEGEGNMSDHFSHLVLLIPDKPDIERDGLAAAWEQRGGTVLRLGSFWAPPALDHENARVYGGETFCLVLQQKLHLELVSPPDDLLLSVPPDMLRRAVSVLSLAELDKIPFPAFIKSAAPKLFRSAIYYSAAAFQAETAGMAGSTLVLVSQVVSFLAEARAFVLDGAVLDCAVYEGEATVAAARAFAEQLAGQLQLPRAVVVDVGLTEQGWAVIEFNAAWGAGLNGCSAAAVVPCVAAASAPGVRRP